MSFTAFIQSIVSCFSSILNNLDNVLSIMFNNNLFKLIIFIAIFAVIIDILGAIINLIKNILGFNKMVDIKDNSGRNKQ